MFSFLIVIGLISGFLAAIMAAIITYLEYTRGDKPDVKLALKLAIKTGLATFFFFVVLTGGITFALTRIIR